MEGTSLLAFANEGFQARTTTCDIRFASQRDRQSGENRALATYQSEESSLPYPRSNKPRRTSVMTLQYEGKKHNTVYTLRTYQ